MILIDSNNFITHLIWSGLIDKTTCGELKEAIELCTVKDVYAKADLMAILMDILFEVEKNSYSEDVYGDEYGIDKVVSVDSICQIIQRKMDLLH